MGSLNAQTRDRWTVDAMAEAIFETYNRATTDQYRNGASWYRDAHHTAATIAEASGHTVDTVAGIIAALSPRMRWGDNVHAAHAVANGRPVRCLSRSRDAAVAIANGADWRDILNGPKTRAFALAVASAGRDGQAVCDAWAVRAATRGEYDAVARCRYDDVAEAYALAALWAGRSVHSMQAIVWTVQRGSHS